MVLTRRRGRANLMSMKTELGDHVRRLRLDQGKTIQQVADTSGLPWRTVHSVENGDSARPRPETLDALAHALGEDASVLALKAYAPAKAAHPEEDRPVPA